MVRPLSRRARLGVATITIILAATQAQSQRVDTVAVGHPALNTVVLRPHADTLDIVRLTGGARQLLSQLVSTVERQAGTPDDVALLRETTGGVQYSTTVSVRTLAPIHHRTVASTDSADVTFTPDRVQGWAVPAHEARKDIDVVLDRAHRPFMAFSVIMRALPFRADYEAIVHTFDAYIGAAGWRRIRVTGADTVTYRGKVGQTWVVIESDDKGTPVRKYWIAKDSRLLLRALSLRGRNDGSELWWFLR